MDCGRTSISLSPEEQLPVFRGRLSRICESDGVLPHSYFRANSRTAEFQHSHLEDIAQKHAMLTNSRIQVGEHRRIQLLPGEHHPKGWIGLNSQIPVENIIHSAVRSTQISPPAPPASRTTTAYRSASSCESEVGWPCCRRPQAAPQRSAPAHRTATAYRSASCKSRFW